jgi:hypothetical protein
MPWGNSGTIMNGMCATAMYQVMGVDPPTHPTFKTGSCFLRKQLGYFFNHKCKHIGSCNTGPSSEGFSYQVGCAASLKRSSRQISLAAGCAIHSVNPCMHAASRQRSQVSQAKPQHTAVTMCHSTGFLAQGAAICIETSITWPPLRPCARLQTKRLTINGYSSVTNSAYSFDGEQIDSVCSVVDLQCACVSHSETQLAVSLSWLSEA